MAIKSGVLNLKIKRKPKDVHTLIPSAQGWCKRFPSLPLAVLLLSNNFAPLLRSRLKLLCQATFSFVVVGVGLFFDWFIMIQL